MNQIIFQREKRWGEIPEKGKITSAFFSLSFEPDLYAYNLFIFNNLNKKQNSYPGSSGIKFASNKKG